jgi:hypothetical protein
MCQDLSCFHKGTLFLRLSCKQRLHHVSKGSTRRSKRCFSIELRDIMIPPVHAPCLAIMLILVSSSFLLNNVWIFLWWSFVRYNSSTEVICPCTRWHPWSISVAASSVRVTSVCVSEAFQTHYVHITCRFAFSAQAMNTSKGRRGVSTTHWKPCLRICSWQILNRKLPSYENKVMISFENLGVEFFTLTLRLKPWIFTSLQCH